MSNINCILRTFLIVFVVGFLLTCALVCHAATPTTTPDAEAILKHADTFRVWLFRIARHCWLDARRRSHSDLKLPMPIDVPATGSGPLNELISDETLEQLQLALAELPSKYRAAYLLWTHEELPYAEIAEILGVNEETARWRVCKARQGLVETMTPYLSVS